MPRERPEQQPLFDGRTVPLRSPQCVATAGRHDRKRRRCKNNAWWPDGWCTQHLEPMIPRHAFACYPGYAPKRLLTFDEFARGILAGLAQGGRMPTIGISPAIWSEWYWPARPERRVDWAWVRRVGWRWLDRPGFADEQAYVRVGSLGPMVEVANDALDGMPDTWRVGNRGRLNEYSREGMVDRDSEGEVRLFQLHAGSVADDSHAYRVLDFPLWLPEVLLWAPNLGSDWRDVLAWSGPINLDEFSAWVDALEHHRPAFSEPDGSKARRKQAMACEEFFAGLRFAAAECQRWRDIDMHPALRADAMQATRETPAGTSIARRR